MASEYKFRAGRFLTAMPPAIKLPPTLTLASGYSIDRAFFDRADFF
jgi:hypothetical protein